MKRFIKNNWLLIGIFLGALLGGICGWLFGESMLRLSMIANIFLKLLKMIMVPLIVFSIMSGIISMGNIKKVGSVGLKTLIYYVSTTFISVIIGITLVNYMEPGKKDAKDGEAVGEKIELEEGRTFAETIEDIVPENVVDSMVRSEILPLIFFSIFFACVLSTLEDKARTVISFVDGVNEAIMKMVYVILYIAPLGIFALVAVQLGKVGGGDKVLQLLEKLGSYMATVIIALFIHGVIILPLILVIFARLNPLKYAVGAMEALLTAFSTDSSSATLPVTMKVTHEKNKVPKKISNFVLPLGATVNMDGTALYEAVAVIFLHQLHGIDLTFSQQVIIFLTSTLAAIGAAGIPHAGFVTMVLILNALGSPLPVYESIGILWSVDWLVDRCRTTVNVWGDTIGAAVITKLEKMDFGGEELKIAKS